MRIVESSIALDFPDANYFRFEECDGYNTIQNHFKEMDAGWHDGNNDTLYLVELKDWTRLSLSNLPRENTNQRICGLVKKSVDSICMLISALLSTAQGEKIQRCLPFQITQETKIRLVSIIHCDSTDRTNISHINTEYRSRLKSYAMLFNIKSYFVVTREKAIERFPWVNVP